MRPAFLSIRDSAEYLNCGKSTIYRYISAGQLHPARHGRRTVISFREIEAFAVQLAEEAGVPREFAHVGEEATDQ